MGAAALDGPKKDALRAFVTATQHAMRDIEADPQKGLDASIARIPELANDRPAQLAVLQATIALWESDYTRANGMGAVDPALWERSICSWRACPTSSSRSRSRRRIARPRRSCRGTDVEPARPAEPALAG